MDALITLVLLGIAAGTAAFTLAKTKITEHGRWWVKKKSTWLGNLFGCPYCLSHWLVAIAVLIYRPRVTDLNIVLDLGVSWLVGVFIAALTFGLIVRQIKALV